MAKLRQNNLEKIKRKHRECNDISTTWLDKNWVDLFLQDFKASIKGDIRRGTLITQCLPPETYQKLAELWDLDRSKTPQTDGNICQLQDSEEENAMVEEFIKNVEKQLGIRSDVSEDLQVDVESIRGSAIKTQHETERKFFKIKEDVDSAKISESNFSERTKKNIEEVRNFLNWYESLGVKEDELLTDENSVMELFEIGFRSQAANALIIRIQEMPFIPDDLAILTNEPKHAVKYALTKYLKLDLKKENLPPVMFAFGKMLPKEEPTRRFKPPKNFIKETWFECKRVPHDLMSFKTVWSGTESFSSTVAFSNWLKNHPEIKPPTYLVEQGLLELDYDKWYRKNYDYEDEPHDSNNVSEYSKHNLI